MSQREQRPDIHAETAAATGWPRAIWSARTPRLGQGQVLALILAGGVVAASVFLVGILVVVHRGEALPGLTVDGVAVGGLGREPVRALLDELMTSRQSEPIIFTHGEWEFVFSPGPQTYAAQLDEGVAAALQAGRTANPLADAWAHTAALWQRPIDVHLPDHVTLEPVRQWVDEVADSLDRDPFPGRVSANPSTAEVSADLPRPGTRVGREEAVQAALAAVTSEGPDRLTLPVEILPQRVADAEVHRLAAIAGVGPIGPPHPHCRPREGRAPTLQDRPSHLVSRRRGRGPDRLARTRRDHGGGRGCLRHGAGPHQPRAQGRHLRGPQSPRHPRREG